MRTVHAGFSASTTNVVESWRPMMRDYIMLLVVATLCAMALQIA